MAFYVEMLCEMLCEMQKEKCLVWDIVDENTVSDPYASLWSYTGETGPEHWGDLHESFLVSKLGCCQSPVDISHVVTADFMPIVFHYAPLNAVGVYDSGHHLGFSCSPESCLDFQGSCYTLLNGHFHVPSEEVVFGERFDMVLHLVHRDVQSNALLVVAVLFSCSREAPVYTGLTTLIENFSYGRSVRLPDHNLPFPLLDFLPAERHAFYTYIGSLTVPPCTEGVRWVILQNPVLISRQEYAEIGKIYEGNVRPLQPLNGRVVYAPRS